MAQSSNALRNPTTDEILTSIREIIEENTGRINNHSDEKMSVVRNQAEANRNASTVEEYEKQDALTVEDAMQALAARIGLRQANQLNSAHQGEETADNNESSETQPSEHIGVSAPNGQMLNNNSGITDENNDFAAQPNVEQFSEANINAELQGEEPDIDVKFGPEFWASVDRFAEQALRPIIIEWLQRRWPALVEKILHEEIVHAFDRNFSSDEK